MIWKVLRGLLCSFQTLEEYRWQRDRFDRFKHSAYNRIMLYWVTVVQDPVLACSVSMYDAAPTTTPRAGKNRVLSTLKHYGYLIKHYSIISTMDSNMWKTIIVKNWTFSLFFFIWQKVGIWILLWLCKSTFALSRKNAYFLQPSLMINDVQLAFIDFLDLVRIT